MSTDTCVFCDECLENGKPVIAIREKGAKTINEASRLRQRNIFVTAGQNVHQECRRDYTNSKQIQKIGKENNESSNRSLRSDEYFSFTEHCLFCVKTAQVSDKKYGIEVYPVRTFDFQHKIEQVCRDRNDTWGNDVLAKIAYAQDLHAAEAIYHQKCSVSFRTGRNIPITTPEQKKKSGRPEVQEASTAFLKTMAYLQENEDDQLTVKDLVEKMRQFCGDFAYSAVHMKSKIKSYFGEEAI